MAAKGAPLLERVAAWRQTLSPWIACLASRLTFDLDALADRDAIARRLWLQFRVPDYADAVRWSKLLEALELLDLLARVDSAACWAILHALCEASETLTRCGCPTAFFLGVQPKYALWMTYSGLPTDETMALVFGTSPSPSAAFIRTKSLLLAALPIHHRDYQLAPIRLRFRFEVMAGRVRPPNEPSRTHDNADLVCLGRAHELAVASARERTTTSRFDVRAFGFTFAHTAVRDDARDLLARIALLIPVFHLGYGAAYTQRRHFSGPFLWHVLAPRAARHSLLGVQKLELAYFTAHAEDIATVASAIAQSRSLREVSFSAKRSARYENGKEWAAYLGFALFRRDATHDIHTVDLRLHSDNISEMAHVLAEENPVMYLAAVHDGLTDNGAYGPTPLTTVRLKSDAKILHDHTSHALEGMNVSDGSHGVEFYVAAHDDSKGIVRVLVPGLGFCFVSRTDVLCETPINPARQHSVRSLTLEVHESFSVEAVASLLALVGEPLTELTLVNYWERIPEALPLSELLRSCPCLKRLELSRMTLSLPTLVPSGWGHDLESLTLRLCEIHHDALKDGPVRVPATMFPRLTSLYVDAKGEAYPPTVPVFFIELAIARDLQRFVVIGDDPTHRETYQSYMQRHNGERVCALPMRHKLALLSALSAGGSDAKYQLHADVVMRILEMVAPTIQAKICTHLEVKRTAWDSLHTW